MTGSVSGRTLVLIERPGPADAARPVAPSPAPPPAKRAGRGAFVVLVCAILAAALVGMLVVNTLLAQGAFRVAELREQQRSLLESEQGLSQAIAAEAAPARLSQRAVELGLVPARTAVFLQLPSGRVLGRPVPALPPTGADSGGDPQGADPRAADEATALP